MLIFYLFYDDRVCRDEDGVWPGQIRYLSVDVNGDGVCTYREEVVDPADIRFVPALENARATQ